MKLLVALCTDRQALVLENIALRQQLMVLQRSAKKAKLEDSDRVFWILLSKIWDNGSWRIKQNMAHLFKTVSSQETHATRHGTTWHENVFLIVQHCPPISNEVIELTKKISLENRTWGSPRTRNEQRKLGHEIAKSTVETYMVKHDDDDRAPNLENFHRESRGRWRCL